MFDPPSVLRRAAFSALDVTGGFAFLTGRRMHACVGPRRLSDGANNAAVAAVAVTATAIAFIVWQVPRVGSTQAG